jgi:MoxR-like ATPase
MEPEDVLYRFDAVARLSEAQVQRSGSKGHGNKEGDRPWLKPANYLVPEILWWAINPKTASAQHRQAQSRCGGIPGGYEEAMKDWNLGQPGPVVLLDEIDKADGDVPNSLLEVLASDGFQLPFGGGHVGPEGDARPLILITTNEERELPAAFLRRCLVHVMDLPKDEVEQAEDLTRRVRAHGDLREVADSVLTLAIRMLQGDRKAALERDLRPPGLAELIDLLRVVTRRGGSVSAQEKRLKENQRFAFQKHRFDP